ncbi:hypothetical protein OPU71_18460 [Niveibacterium sp. 24ML]|uniref:hypothetical protein n=1 Tax=Niveibacterium sp. 24ML TaxID=2985512 RepID=UPI00226E8C4B|nr:hypothetical protein [Niveibacterium sp. 24ML]MCX9158109.1 hypothetical protein [Niveibacterium sp. 24ML]
MSVKDMLKVLAMLLFAVAGAALIVHARVDLGMTLEQMTDAMSGWTSTLLLVTAVIVVQLLVWYVLYPAMRSWMAKMDQQDTTR